MIADTVALSEAADVAEVSNPVPEQQTPRTTTAAQANSPAAALSQGTVMPQAAVVQAFGEAAVAPAAAASASVSDAAVVSVAPAGAGTARQAQTLPGAEVKSPAEEALKGMSREVVEQVKVNITKSAVKGVDKIDVTLKPEDLGHIEIKCKFPKTANCRRILSPAVRKPWKFCKRTCRFCKRRLPTPAFRPMKTA